MSAKLKGGDYSHGTLQLTSRLLNLNPEYYTIWNHRRLILEHVFAKELALGDAGNGDGDGDGHDNDAAVDESDKAAAEKDGLSVSQREILLVIKEDLQYQMPLLKQWPKCYWIWNHRRWLLVTATQHLPAHATLDLWSAERALVTKMLAMDSRNFHGWGYRRQVTENIERLSGKSMAEPEFEYTTNMIQSNLSNFSAWHNRGQLIPRLLDERRADAAARKELYDEEFQQITNALYTDPYDQSLWFYHHYLMSALDHQNPKAPSILKGVTNRERLHYLEQEIDSIKEMLDGAEDCKYIYQALLDYSRRYLRLDAGGKKVTTVEMKQWLDELKKIDPLRHGRWQDLEERLKL